jgi:competence protein ComEC
VLNKISSLNHQCDIAVSGDRIETGGLRIEFLQADLNAAGNTADNASSLVAVLRIAGRCICLPGDLEGQGQQQLLSGLPQCDLLLSPHHGSLAANPKALATRTLPQNVVVSARDNRLRNALQSVYDRSTLWMTSEAGAVSYRITADGETTISSYAESQTAGL